MAEIKYKETTIPVEAGQTVILNTIDRKLTGDIKVITPKTETIEEWDGSHTISGGIELISFTIAGAPYQAEAGMTWAEWGADEAYTKGDYDVLGDYYVYKSDTRQPVTTNANGSGSFVNRTDVIITGHSYGIQPADN